MNEKQLSGFQQAVQQLSERAMREDVERRREAMITVMAALYDKSAMYTNLIIVAGYAAFFTAWGTMKSTMTQTEILVAAFSLSVSLCVFVA